MGRFAYRSFITALQFLTRIPTPDIGAPTPEEVQHSRSFYPLVGVMIGVLLAGVSLISHVLIAQTLMDAVIVVAADAWWTGGLHLDGLMDSADGLLSYRSRERMLEIMRDSRVGAMGVLAVMFTILLRVAALSSLTPVAMAEAVFLGALYARSLLLLLLRFTGSARTAGRGHEVAQGISAQGGIIATVCSLAVAYWVFGGGGLIACAVAGLCVSYFATVCKRRLGGMTGDTYGASIELTQLITTLVLAARGIAG